MPSLAPTVAFPSPDVVDGQPSLLGGPGGLPTPPAGYYDDKFAETNALIDSAGARFDKYQGGGVTKFLNKTGDHLSVIQTDVAKVQSFASPLQQTVMDSEPVKVIRQSITALVEGLPSLLKVLDDVAQIHPFIKIVVGAFRVAVELDFKRKDNDKKISLLFVEMRDMMAVLIQLQDINKDKREGGSGQTIESRMQHLVQKTEEDIRKCANACNAYAKKKLLSKVLQSSSWDDTFQGYIKTFTNRRGEFEFALSLFIGRAVNAANDMLLTLDQKMNRVLQFFEACASPEERELSRLVGQHGGPNVVMKDEKALREIYNTRAAANAGIAKPTERRNGRHAEPVDEFETLKQDLKVDPAIAIRDNLEQFERKFLIQQREVEEEMRRAIHREGDRIIQSVTSGPHDKILDPDIHDIWKEMRWGGSVKARHFVLALRDHFREKLDQLKRVKTGETPIVAAHQLSEQDEWTLDYINVTRLQPIIEAFDDDASGYITVAEVNAFTTARPNDWSLLHWLAYWAVGHQMVMTGYAEKIDNLLAKMFSLKSQVLPANRSTVDQYLDRVWTAVTEFTAGLRRAPSDDILLARFESYIVSEEDRLRKNLETVRYDFDAADTVELVRGPGRIEKHLFPMLYLMLKRDFEIMRLARSRLLHVDELYDAIDTFVWFFEAVQERCQDLEDLFKQQKQDPAQQFKLFAFELFKYWHDNTELWSMKRLREAKFTEVAYDDSVEAQGIEPATILNHPIQRPEELFLPHPFDETDDDEKATDHLLALLGHWSCFCGMGDRWPSRSMMDFDFHASPSDPKAYHCSGMVANGTNWTCEGKYNIGDDDKVEYQFVITYAARFASEYYRGQIAQDGREFAGEWSYGEDFAIIQGRFVCKRLPGRLMRLWPTPGELQENKPRALWRFAISATIEELPSRLRSWAGLKKRWENGQRYMELIVRREIGGLSQDESRELSRCQLNMMSNEARLYQLFREFRERSIPLHFDVGCDVCGKNIRGARVLCLSCGTKTTIDLCDAPGCRDGEVGLETRDDLTSPHLPTHDVFKVRRAIHQILEFGPAHRAAQQALKRAREALSEEDKTEQQPNPAPEESAAQLSEEQPVQPTEIPTKDKVVRDKLLCIKCNERVTQPCWYCTECEDDVFVCGTCDERHGGISSGKHKSTHGLVRCQPEDPGTDADSEHARLHARIDSLESSIKDWQYKIEQRFGVTDDKMDVVQDRLGGKIAAVNEQLGGQMSAVEDRLGRIESLLLVLGRRMGSDRDLSTRTRGTRHASLFGDLDAGRSAGTLESDFSAWVREQRSSP